MWAEVVHRYLGAVQRSKGNADTRIKVLRKFGAYDGVPLGAGDSKTEAPGMYRPTGTTCPDSCAHLQAGSCYTFGGNVNMHQVRASADPVAGAKGALAAVVAARAVGQVARLLVSGDFGKTDDDVDAFAREVVRALHAYRWATGDLGVVAWTYSHHPRTKRWAGALRSVGVVVRWSGQLGPSGAVTYPFDRVRELGVSYAKCPAQLRDVSCAECRLCWTKPELTIVFKPHGHKRNRAPLLG